MAKRALEMIVNLETLVITNIKHQLQYTKWAVGQISKHQERAAEPSSWEDRMGGQFTQEEIDRSRRGGEGW